MFSKSLAKPAVHLASLTCLFALMSAEPAAAGPTVTENHMDQIDTIQNEEAIGFRNGSVVVAPIPFSNPTIGAGLVLGAGYLFNLDETSKPSMIGLAGLRSDNGSTGYGLAANFAFDNNRWLIESMFAKADARYDLYTSVGKLPIGQKGTLARLSFAYGISSEMSFGASLRYLDTVITPSVNGLPPIPPPLDQFLNTEIATLGLFMDLDKRDDTLYPTKGSSLHIEVANGYSLSGIASDYTTGYMTYAHFHSISKKGVIAAIVSACGASSSTPFFDQCGLGTIDGFRGFSAMQFFDARSAAAQIEYRHRFTDRFGAVAFAGAGQVGPTLSQLSANGTHSAAGLGIRYRVSKKFPVDFSVDYSRNNLKEEQLYVYVGQRF
ncbi:BamA/TamA family outer membrane protein [Phaeobacter sp. NW0010-22]|uniref:BamA/TamA family outer membrane protein n=1 Tax=Phaeobacter sp. NW0010-22 TaxID=3135907 RepID=UPI003104C6F7